MDIQYLLQAIIVIVIGYFFLKFLRSFWQGYIIKRHRKKIVNMYNELHKKKKEELDYYLEALDGWQQKVKTYLLNFASEEKIKENIDSKKLELEHEENLYHDFIRLTFRFSGSKKETIDCIVWYHTYLKIRLDSYADWEHRRLMMQVDAESINNEKTWNEWHQIDEEREVMLEELERKLKTQLAINPE
jgi:hypothetical protein